MNTKNLVALALLVGMGAVLHTIVPPFILGMKPDMMLTMMFLGIILFPDKKSVLLVALVTGILSAMTTGFPGGQIPNIIDKLVTAFVFYGLLTAFRKFHGSVINAAVLTAVGTIVSGTVFLASAYLIVGLPGAFVGLFAGAVLPAVVFNAAFMAILFPVALNIFKRAKLAEAN
ncbi:tryptophan transporter [Mesobacillus campisalis]|uniref:Tryptophan transporter n=1 Tax=Mesobacillus campisalis TaxID=1408103 RepID=A0A0M2SMT9_9BACI|nr:tryptophan transporter [Mesobacillus campisalis]KKK35989.1 tryptophan transporter [Mesobacillus campisalis]